MEESASFLKKKKQNFYLPRALASMASTPKEIKLFAFPTGISQTVWKHKKPYSKRGTQPAKARQKNKRFFASFFQKRSAFFPFQSHL
jgi:hypothetical protein